MIMRTTLLMIAVSSLLASPAFAESKLKCKSANYMISIIEDQQGNRYGNYGINGWENDAADVEIEKSYFSDRVIAVQLNVDGQSNKFELSVTKTGPSTYAGKIFQGKFTQNANCTFAKK